MNATQSIESALESLARSRDPEAWEQLVMLAGGEIFELSRQILRDPHLADDATQETLLYVRDSAGQYRPSAEPSARRWILRIACTTALKIMRTRKRTQAREENYAALSMANRMPGGDPAEGAAGAELSARVRYEVEALPDAQRLPILCHYYGGMEYSKVASELGCPVGTAKTNVHRGLEKLRERMAVLGVVAGTAQLEPALRVIGEAKVSAIQMAKWKALLTAPKLAAASSVAATGGLSLMAKIGIGSAALVLATTAAVVAPRVFSSSAPAAAPVATAPAPVAALDKARALTLAKLKISEALGKEGEAWSPAELNDARIAEEIRPAAFPGAPGAVPIVNPNADGKFWVTLIAIDLNDADQSVWWELQVMPDESVKEMLRTPLMKLTADIRARAMPQWEKDLLARLQKPVTFDFVETSLEEAVNFHKAISGANISVSPEAEKAGALKKTMNLRLSDVPIAKSLELMAYVTGLSLKYRDGGAVFDVADPKAKRHLHIPGPADEATRRKLARRVTFEFVDQDLSDAINFLNSLTRVNMVVHPAVQAKATVTLRVDNMTLERALFWICALTRNKFRVEDGIVLIEPANLDGSLEALSKQLDTKLADPVAGLSVEKAIETVCAREKIKCEIDPAIPVDVRSKIVAAAAVPAGGLPIGLALADIASANSLQIKTTGNGLKVIPHVQGVEEFDFRVKFKNKATFEFVDTSAEEALAFVRQISGVTMIVLPSMVKEAAAPAIQLKANDMELSEALRQIVAQAGAAYVFRNGAIVIGPPAELWGLKELPAPLPVDDPPVQKAQSPESPPPSKPAPAAKDEF
jgi:RNA polymerase sigma-70 factor (ECF subfamily)